MTEPDKDLGIEICQRFPVDLADVQKIIDMVREREMTESDMRALIRREIKISGLTQEAWAARKKFSPQFICDVLSARRGVSASLAESMGYERKVIFVEKK